MHLEIILALFVLLMVFGWISSLIRKMGEQQGSSGSSSGSGGQNPSMDELAARRRQQLRELARRRGQRGDFDAPDYDEPEGLTPAERRHREAARAEYERRAAALRRQAEAQEARRTGRPSDGRGGGGYPDRSAEAVQRQGAAGRRPSGPPQRRQGPPPPPSGGGQAGRQTAAMGGAAAAGVAGGVAAGIAGTQTQRSSTTPATPSRGRGRGRGGAEVGDIAESARIGPLSSNLSRPFESDLTRRHMTIGSERLADETADQAEPPTLVVPGRPGGSPAIIRLDSDNMRQAFIIREVLDRPVAMRSTQGWTPI